MKGMKKMKTKRMNQKKRRSHNLKNQISHLYQK